MLNLILKRSRPEFTESALDLLVSTSRKLIILIGGLYIGWQLLVFLLQRQEYNMRVFPITLEVVLTFGLALWLLDRHYFWASALWQVGFMGMVTLWLMILQVPEIALLYALLPLTAAVTMGWPLGLCAEAGIIVLMMWMPNAEFLPALPANYGPLIIFAGAFTGLLGWASTSSLLTVTEWSVFHYEDARQKMEEARDQRLELKQVQEDLILANRELARLNERLKAMTQVAEEARRIKEEFVANVSHELRTPLNMIIGFCEMITQSPKVYGRKLPPLLLADIATIQRNSQHLADLVNDVLDLSQVESGRMALTRQWVILQDIVAEAMEAVYPLFLSKGLYLKNELPKEPIRIFCDGTRLREVVLNLLSNAGRFTESGGVWVRACVKDDRVEVSVADTGPGIAPEDQERLFEPFQQLDSSIRRRFGGSGLGLSISKRFIEMHGGKLWLESAIGQGTTFYFSLPQERPVSLSDQEGPRVARWVNPFTVHEARSRPFKAPPVVVMPRFVVLEVEEMLARYLRRYIDGIEVLGVKTVAEAVAIVKDSPVQAVILNTLAQDEALNALTAQLGPLPYKPPVVSCWVPGIDEAARRLGVIRYLVKPVARQALIGALMELERPIERILLVDDNTDALQLFTRMLSSGERTYDIIRAVNGPMALSLMREREPDVVLLDLILPGIDGFEVLAQKNQDPQLRDIPVIVISSQDPTGSPIITKNFVVTRADGLSVLDLMSCIQMVADLLNPRVRSDGPAPTGVSPA